MSWSEFCSLLSGIMPDTPLGQIVSIRAEKNPKVIAKFSKEQKRIRNDWLKRKNQEAKESGKGAVDWAAFQTWAKQAFN